MNRCMVTTMDNKWNPFTDFDEWLAYDMNRGLSASACLAYYFNDSPLYDEEQYNEEVSKAISTMMEKLPFGFFIKIYENDASTLIPLANKAFDEMMKDYGLTS